MGGKTSAASINKYKAKAYDRIGLEVPKGDKEKILNHATSHGESINGFIRRAIQNQMERDTAAAPADTEQSAAEQKEVE